MTTGKFTLVIRWPSGQSTICGEMTDHQHGEICRILSPDYRAQLPSQGGEAVAWHTDDHLTDKSATTYDREVAERWSAKGWPVAPLYTHPADQVAGPSKQIAWKRRDGVMGCKRFMTQKCYDAQSPQMKGNYDPLYCAHCKADQVAKPDAELVELLREAVRVLDGWKSTDDLDSLQERIDAKLASLEVKP